jgi:16S rRNA (uracil1498-N3)-methyltransferase
MIHRFYVAPERIHGDTVEFTSDQRKQIKTVLRLRPNDLVAAFDGSGREFAIRIEALDPSAFGRILETRSPDVEPPIRLTLVQGLPKGDKIDLILQKCTEIGVSRFLLVETARSVPRIPQERLVGRLERWHAIVREAAEQSGRVRLPEIGGVVPFRAALSELQGQKAFIAWEEERSRSLAAELSGLEGAHEAVCFIGPEGGFTSDEVDAAARAGATPVSLGPRILRTETAAIVASSLIICRG